MISAQFTRDEWAANLVKVASIRKGGRRVKGFLQTMGGLVVGRHWSIVLSNNVKGEIANGYTARVGIDHRGMIGESTAKLQRLRRCLGLSRR